MTELECRRIEHFQEKADLAGELHRSIRAVEAGRTALAVADACASPADDLIPLQRAAITEARRSAYNSIADELGLASISYRLGDPLEDSIKQFSDEQTLDGLPVVQKASRKGSSHCVRRFHYRCTLIGALKGHRASREVASKGGHHRPRQAAREVTLADINTPNPLGAASRQPRMNEQPSSESTTGMADQAKEALRNVADRASDTLSDVSERGAGYYRRGSQAVGNVDSATMTGLFIAGAIGFGIAWLIFGQQSRSGDYVARRMSYGSERDY